MKKTKCVLISVTLAAIVAFFVCINARADGSFVTTNRTMGSYIVLESTWTSLTNASSGTLTNGMNYINGKLMGITIKNGTLTNDYGINITDRYGYKIVSGYGVVSNASVQSFCPVIKTYIPDWTSTVSTNLRPYIIDGALTLSVTNTGIGSGQIIFYIEP